MIRRKFSTLRTTLGAVAAMALTAAALVLVPATAAGASTVVVSLSIPSTIDADVVVPIDVTYSCSGDEDCEDVVIELSSSGALPTDSQTCPLGTVATGSSSGLAGCTLSVRFPSTVPDGATGTITAVVTLSNGAGNTAQRTITAVNPGGGTTTTTTAPTTTTNPPGPTTTTTTTTRAPRPRIWIDKSKNDGSLYPGQVFRFTFRVRNRGDFALTDVIITDDLPTEFVYSNPVVGNGGTARLSGTQLTIEWDDLAVGQEVTASVEATVVYPAPI